MHDKDLAYQYGQKNRESIELNSFILHLFNNDALKIEDVLKDIIEKNITITDTDLEKFWEGNEEILCDEVLQND